MTGAPKAAHPLDALRYEYSAPGVKDTGHKLAYKQGYNQALELAKQAIPGVRIACRCTVCPGGVTLFAPVPGTYQCDGCGCSITLEAAPAVDQVTPG